MTPSDPTREAIRSAITTTYKDSNGEGWRLVAMAEDGGVVTTIPVALVDSIIEAAALPTTPAPLGAERLHAIEEAARWHLDNPNSPNAGHGRLRAALEGAPLD